MLTVYGHPTLPDDEYALLEAFCDDPTCDCRRGMLSIIGRRQHGVLAYIGYAFDRDDEFAGPYLDPLNRQSRHAEALLTLVAPVLADKMYRKRLEAHYHQLKRAAGAPAPIMQQKVAPLPNNPPRQSRHRSGNKKKR